MRVSINILRGNQNALPVCRAFAQGVVHSSMGDKAVLRRDTDYDMKGYDVAAFWGYVQTCQRLVQMCRDQGIPFIYFDLPYWDHAEQFKVSINDRHPTAYLMDRVMPADRWDKLGIKLAPWKINGKHILVAGMSGKAAWSWGMKDEEYERNIIPKIAAISQRPIIYRPKPSWPGSTPIPGSTYDKVTPITKLLADAHIVVTHHSNVGVDALVAGVPVIARRGAATHLGLPDTELERIETPLRPAGREQFVANLAYCQWTMKELSNGVCWRHVRTLL